MVNVLLYNGDVCSAHQGHTNSPKATIDRDPIKISLQTRVVADGRAQRSVLIITNLINVTAAPSARD